MPEDLAKFLNKDVKNEGVFPEVLGGYSCQECLEAVSVAFFNEEEGILFWFCKENHRSQVTL